MFCPVHGIVPGPEMFPPPEPMRTWEPDPVMLSSWSELPLPVERYAPEPALSAWNNLPPPPIPNVLAFSSVPLIGGGDTHFDLYGPRENDFVVTTRLGGFGFDDVSIHEQIRLKNQNIVDLLRRQTEASQAEVAENYWKMIDRFR